MMTDTLVTLTESIKCFFNNMWKLNLDTEVKITNLKGSKIYTIDNVFAEPKKLERFLFSRHTALVEDKEPFQANGDQFLKGRYHDFRDKAAPLVWLSLIHI